MHGENLQRLINGIDTLLDAVGTILDSSGHSPWENSIAFHEFNAFERPASLDAAFSQGTILIEAAADQMMSFTRSITEPVLTIAPWTSVRSILEASAVSSWLLHPALSARDRVMRSYSLRLEGLVQQARFARSLGNTKVVDQVQARIEKIEGDANQLGYESIRNDKGKLVDIGERMPSSTYLVGETLNEEATYRLLSAAVHGHSWALQQIGFKKVESDGSMYLEKSIEPTAILYLSNKAVRSFFLPVSYKTNLFGWDSGDAPELVDSILGHISSLFDPSKYPPGSSVEQSA